MLICPVEQKGNDFFKKGVYEESERWYSAALKEIRARYNTKGYLASRRRFSHIPGGDEADGWLHPWYTANLFANRAAARIARSR